MVSRFKCVMWRIRGAYRRNGSIHFTIPISGKPKLAHLSHVIVSHGRSYPAINAL